MTPKERKERKQKSKANLEKLMEDPTMRYIVFYEDYKKRKSTMSIEEIEMYDKILVLLRDGFD